MTVNDFTYRVTWSAEDNEHVGLCTEFPSLSWLSKTPNAALNGICNLVAETIADLKQCGEPIPEPLTERRNGLIENLNMKDLMQYKGYFGSAHYDCNDQIFHGKIESVRALVTYEATDEKGLKKAFEEAVDDYLATCNQQGIEPEKIIPNAKTIRAMKEARRGKLKSFSSIDELLDDLNGIKKIKPKSTKQKDDKF